MNELTLETALKTALNRIEDMLSDDDGQAFKEARKFLPVGRAALAALRSMPAEPLAVIEARGEVPEQQHTNPALDHRKCPIQPTCEALARAVMLEQGGTS